MLQQLRPTLAQKSENTEAVQARQVEIDDEGAVRRRFDPANRFQAVTGDVYIETCVPQRGCEEVTRARFAFDDENASFLLGPGDPRGFAARNRGTERRVW